MGALKREAKFRWVMPVLGFVSLAFTILIIAFDNWISYWMLSLSVCFQLSIVGINAYTRIILRNKILDLENNVKESAKKF